MRTVVLAPGRAKPLWKGHPWVFADSVDRVEGEGDADWVRVVDGEDRLIGCGLYSPTSAIRVRLVVRGEAVDDPAPILAERIRTACALRTRMFPDPAVTSAYRLIHADGDGLPGLVVDRLGEHLVAQFGCAATHARREALSAVLLEASGATGLIARSAGFEEAEGIAEDDAAFSNGDAVPESLVIREAGMQLIATPRAGQKTGHYSDQRENRRLVGELAQGLDVLDLYCGTGGFALQALRHGAIVALAIDGSQPSLDAAQEAAALNGVSDRLYAQREDATKALAALRAAKQRFGLVIVDPPNFFPRKGPARGAPKAYRELNVRALSRVESNGFLATFSCSAKLGADALLELCRSASRECRRPFSVLRELTAGPDHPVAHGLPEGRYLSGLLLRVGSSYP